MFITASEAAELTCRARRTTNFDNFCEHVNNKIEYAAKHGDDRVVVCSDAIAYLTPAQRKAIKESLMAEGYTVKWKSLSEYEPRLMITWEGYTIE